MQIKALQANSGVGLKKMDMLISSGVVFKAIPERRKQHVTEPFVPRLWRSWLPIRVHPV
jgi:hypothetical protein